MATENPHKTFLGIAESISKMGAISFAAIYAIGYLVASLYLSHYGIVSAELFRIQYVVTGVWAILSPGVVLFLILFGYDTYKIMRQIMRRASAVEADLLRNEGEVCRFAANLG